MTDERWSEVGRRIDQRYYGKYHGFVYDNQDPKKRGRLRLIVPEVLGDVPTGWAEPCFPYGGGVNFGDFRVPPVTRGGGGSYTTGVWVEFRHGNPQYPIWVGCFFGAPGGEPEAPGEDDEADPDIDVHVSRTFSGHSIVAVDRVGEERIEIRDTAGQTLTMVSPLREGTKRDADGNPMKTTEEVEYGDLVANEASIELCDFAGNTVLLDAQREAPTIIIRNTDREGHVLQTIELHGERSDARIVIRDNNENVVTLDKLGVRIEALGGTDTIVMSESGIAEDAPQINLNSGILGAARLTDLTQSTMATDPVFWTYISTLMRWLGSHQHMNGGGITTPPTVPFPATIPTTCTGNIITSSKTVIIGD